MCHSQHRAPRKESLVFIQSRREEIFAIDRLAQRSAVQGRPGGQQLGVVDGRDENNVYVLIHAASRFEKQRTPRAVRQLKVV